MPQRGITVKSKWYAGFAFDSDASSIDYEDDVLSLRDADRQTVATVHVGDLDEMTKKRGTFSNELRVSSRNGKTWVCRGMQSGPSTKLTRIVQRRIHYHRIEEAKPISRKVAPKILEMRARLGHWLTGHDRYRRRSETDPLSADIQGVLSRCDKYVIECLDSQATRELQQLTKLGAPNTLEKARQHTNRSYLENDPSGAGFGSTDVPPQTHRRTCRGSIHRRRRHPSITAALRGEYSCRRPSRKLDGCYAGC